MDEKKCVCNAVKKWYTKDNLNEWRKEQKWNEKVHGNNIMMLPERS